MQTYYRVAEHVFAVESSDSGIFALLDNYQPFEVPLSLLSKDERGTFTMIVERQSLHDDIAMASYTHVFTDCVEDDMPRIEVYQCQGFWMMRMSQVATSSVCCELIVTDDFTEGKLHISSQCQDVRFCVDSALMLMYAFRTASLRTLELHAAVVVKENENGEAKGYLFLGKSGTGKSTHARQWLRVFPDAYLLNDDNPILRIMDSGDVRVYGSPWSGKTPCYINAHARVGGIVKLAQSSCNQLRALSLPEAYANLLSASSGLKMDKNMADDMYETIKYIITNVPCYHLDCLPNVESAELCFRAM